MEISRRNLNFRRTVNIEEIINNSIVSPMSHEEISHDLNICDIHFDDNEMMVVFHNPEEPYQDEKYCYMTFFTHYGEDNHTKMLIVNKVITDNNLIRQELFARLFDIFLANEDNNEYPNRIVIGNTLNERFHGNNTNIANAIADYIYSIYSNYTSDFVTSYRIRTDL